MTPTIDLDDKIRDLVHQLDRATPAPPAFADLHHYGRPQPSRIVPLTAAAVIAAIGVGGLVAVNARGDGPAPPTASQPAPAESLPAAPPTALVVTGPLLSTPIDSTTAPLILLDQPGWTLTSAYSDVGPALRGGFEGSTVLIGEGPRYDAPLFAATVVDPEPDGQTEGTVPSVTSLLEMGDPIDVGGTTGSIVVNATDADSGLEGPIVAMFWPLGDGRTARVNSVRLGVDKTVAMANQLALVDGTLTMPPPAGFRQLDTPTGGDRRSVNVRYANGDAELEVVGANRGVASLLGRIAGEVRTTRVVDGVEVADRPQPARPGDFWVDWQVGDWSFYVIASGFADEDAFVAALSSLTLSDAATFEATAADVGLVMPGQHPELAAPVLAHVDLSDPTRQQAVTTELPMSLDSFAFQLFQGASCVWFADWTVAVGASDETSKAALRVDVAEAIAAAAGTEFERSASILAAPLLQIMNDEVPSTPNDYTNDCPAWAIAD